MVGLLEQACLVPGLPHLLILSSLANGAALRPAPKLAGAQCTLCQDRTSSLSASRLKYKFAVLDNPSEALGKLIVASQEARPPDLHVSELLLRSLPGRPAQD